MDIQPISSNKFIVGLSCDDMKQLDITYDDMDYSNVETRRVIWTILDTVRRNTGRDVDPSGNLVIEAAPDMGGGCLLVFTVPSEKNHVDSGTVISKSNATQIFEFHCLNNFLDAIKSAQLENSGCRFFTDGEKYRIEISAEYVAACERILKEYGFFAGKDCLTAAYTHEHWKELFAH